MKFIILKAFYIIGNYNGNGIFLNLIQIHKKYKFYNHFILMLKVFFNILKIEFLIRFFLIYFYKN